jgi:hypothetical protein
MRYIVSKDLPDKLHEASEFASRFFYSSFGLVAKPSKPYTFTVKSPEQVAMDIKNRHTAFEVRVVAWRPFNPWTSAIATTYTSDPTTIHINVRKIAGRDTSDYVATLVHEALHLMGYGHGDNRNQHREPKLSSVPIAVAQMAKEWFSRS